MPNAERWIKGGGLNNQELHGSDESFYISYAESAPSSMAEAIMQSPTGVDETAIVLEQGRTYYILDGDWRDEYEKIIDEGKESCIEFYKNHQEDWSSWSNEFEGEDNA